MTDQKNNFWNCYPDDLKKSIIRDETIDSKITPKVWKFTFPSGNRWDIVRMIRENHSFSSKTVWRLVHSDRQVNTLYPKLFFGFIFCWLYSHNVNNKNE